MQPDNNANNINNMNNANNEKNKMSKKQIIGLVVLSLIAIGGALFGVYGMNSQNEKIAELTTRADDAEGKVAELETEKVTITGLSEGTEIADSGEVSSLRNPIIRAPGDSGYDVLHNIPVYAEGTNANIYFQTKNGQFYSCQITNVAESDCDVSGLPEGVYKMATIYEGNGMGDEKIGFLMSDGSVWYAYVYENDGTLNVDKNMVVKKANIDGFVKDIVSINYCSVDTHYCNGSTVFVMGDDSIVKYDNSMFE